MKENNMIRVAGYVGKFYPPHIGHQWVIDTLNKDFDKFYIIISSNKQRNKSIKESSGFEELDAKLIKQWFEKHYENNKKVKVEIFDESNFKPYPEDRDKWAEQFKKKFPQINAKIADESYREYNQKYFAEYEFVSIPRDVVNIHSTQIRNDIKNNLNYLLEEAKEYFKNREK